MSNSAGFRMYFETDLESKLVQIGDRLVLTWGRCKMEAVWSKERQMGKELP